MGKASGHYLTGDKLYRILFTIY